MATPNHLKGETSPYLLQHADNPVEWYPWGEAAFAKAKKEDKPIFLSIGYATCHWCHVMEKESFEDEEVAGILNRYFVSIKVDREERPDVDGVYMQVCQMMTGSGGWPLTIVMTPDKHPFFAGTYIPKASLINLLIQVADLWQNQRETLFQSANQVTAALNNLEKETTGTITHKDWMTPFARIFDSRYGGFHGAPKFPTPSILLFLLSQAKDKQDQPFQMVEKTLYGMLLGGIWDHPGGGLHRYSTTSDWRIPHYEKMLYDQALLLLTLTHAYALSGDEFYKKRAEALVDFVLRELTHPKGGFYTALDADSEGEEGKYYLWSQREIEAILPTALARWFIPRFHVTPSGSEPLYLDTPIQPEEEKKWQQARRLLMTHRDKRVPPCRDDKILTDQNGLMMGALALAGVVMDHPAWLDQAIKTGEFLKVHVTHDKDELYHAFTSGKAHILGYASDYAGVIFGFIHLYQATQHTPYLEEAIQLSRKMDELFWGGRSYYLTSTHHDPLPFREKPLYDGAIPSPNSLALENHLWLYHLTGNPIHRERMEKLIESFAPYLNRSPAGFAFALRAYQRFKEGISTLVVVIPEGKSYGRRKGWLNTFPLSKVLIEKKEGDKTLETLCPYTKPLKSLKNQVTYYLCQNFACQLPVTSWQALLHQWQNTTNKP